MSKMASQSRIRKQFGAILDQKAGELIRFQAIQGDGTGTVKVPGKTNYIYIRRLGRSRFEECLNVKLAPRNDLPIIVGYTAANPGTLEALEVDWIAITDPGDYVYVPHHHQSHELGNEHGGDDVVWVQKQQVLPMLCRPTDPASMFVIVLDDWYPWAAGWHYFAGATSADLSGYIPALFGEARFVLVSIDGATNVLQYTSGSTFTIGLPLENIDVRVPAPPLGCVPVCAVYIAGTTTALNWGNLYDVRLFNSPGAGSIAPNPDLWENVIVVAKSGGQWVLVQDGLDAADGGDTVLVMPGDYTEDLTAATGNVTLLGLAAKHVTGAYGTQISGDSVEVGPMFDESGVDTICNILFHRTLTQAGGGYTVLRSTAHLNLIDCRIHVSEGATGRNVLSLSAGCVGGTTELYRCHVISPGANSPTAVSLNGGTVGITDCQFYGDVVCSASTQVTIQGSYIDGDLTGVAGSNLVIIDSVVTGIIAGWDSVTYHGLSTFPLGTAHQLVKVNAGGTNPIWASFDWDEMATAAAADMVHDHSAAGEGGEVPLASLGGYTQGDLIYGGAADWQDLVHPGAVNRVLQSSATEVVWSANAVTFPAAGTVPVGSGAANRIAYWTAADTLASDAGLTYDAATDSLTIAGGLAVGSVAVCAASRILDVDSIVVGATAFGIHCDPSVNLDTDQLIGMYARADTEAAAITLGISRAIYIDDPIVGGGSTITTACGLYIAAITAAGTNYAIYSAGGESYHAGDVDIDGHLAVGNNAILTSSEVHRIREQVTATAAAADFGMFSWMDYDPTGNFNRSIYALGGRVELGTAHTRLGGSLIGFSMRALVADGIDARNVILLGGEFIADVEDAGSGGGTGASYAYGILAFTPYVDTGTCNKGYGIQIAKGTLGAVAAGNRITNTLYGLYISNMVDAKATTSYAIYCSGGNSYHAGKVAIGGTISSLAQLHVDQNSASGAIPVLLLDQADLSEEFIELKTTVGAGNPIDTAAIGTYYGKMRVNIAGVGYKYIALYNS